jgi:monoamine oxidase
MTIDVVVIGAGLAGLSAADRLRARGRSVTVLEARDRVGGRTHTTTLCDVNVDVGGQWVGPTQDRAYGLIRELGLETYPQYRRGRNLLELGGALRSYRGWLPRIPVLHLIDLWVATRRIERMARTIDVNAPAATALALRWDTMSVADWIEKHVRTRNARKILELASLAILAAEPRDVSLLHMLFYVRSAGGLSRLAEVEGGAQEERIVGGAQSLSEGLAARLPGQVLLSSPVKAIEQSDSHVIVRAGASGPGAGPGAKTSELRAYQARRVILAIPPALAAGIEYSPALPQGRARLHTSMPMGSMIKCVLAYERPFWRDAGFSGEAVSDQGPVRMVFDACSGGQGPAMLIAFVPGDDARRFSQVDADTRKQAVISSVVRFFGPEAATPMAYIDKDWVSDPWSGGCYAGQMAPGVMTELGAALRQPCGRLHFAGTETATRWAGYMDGAIESGVRAADEIDERLRNE